MRTQRGRDGKDTQVPQEEKKWASDVQELNVVVAELAASLPAYQFYTAFSQVRTG